MGFAQMFRDEGRQEGHQKGHQKGHQEGRQEGRQEGQREGEARILSYLLQYRFGNVPAWAHEKITQADMSTLENWSLRVLDANARKDVFS